MILTGNKDSKSFFKLKNVIEGRKIIFTTFFPFDRTKPIFFIVIFPPNELSPLFSPFSHKKKNVLILLAAGKKIIELQRGQHLRGSHAAFSGAFTFSGVINIHLYRAACRIITVNSNEHALTSIYAHRKQQTGEWQRHLVVFYSATQSAWSVTNGASFPRQWNWRPFLACCVRAEKER